MEVMNMLVVEEESKSVAVVNLLALVEAENLSVAEENSQAATVEGAKTLVVEVSKPSVEEEETRRHTVA